MKCNECSIDIFDEDYVVTVYDTILCYGCDCKRLIKEQ